MQRIDIDLEEYIDVPELFPSGRQKVIDYVVEKYGKDKVCQILAMGTMGTRSVLKDVGRALKIDHMEITQLNKFIPMDAGMQWPLAHCLYGDDEHGREPIQEVVDFAEKYPELIEISLEFQGMPRHHSIHAAGVVISPVPVTEVFPLCLGGDDEIVSQFDKHWVEELGALKMDFLGLKTLGVMHQVIDLIRKRHSKIIDLDDIPFDDQKVLNYIKEGNTEGVFQIESGGFKGIFRDMDEVNFEDIIVALSLYRPGPMKMIPQYIATKNGYMEPEYLFPELKQILEPTFGILIYQEQVIQIATKLAGYSEGEADLFRRAIGKKDEELIKEQIDILINGQEATDKKKYIPGLVRNGIPKDKAEKLGKDIVSFSAYAFNRSHKHNCGSS